MYKPLFAIKQNKSELSFTTTMDGKYPIKVFEAMTVAQRFSRQAVSMANLNGIGKCIMVYEDAHGKAPENLNELVKGNFLSAQMLVSPQKPRKLKTDDKGIPTEPGDYVYFMLPKDADGSLLRAYEPAELNDGKGGAGLFADGSVRWLKADELKKAIEKTQEALKNPK